METIKNTNTVLKQALEQRQVGGVSSNLSFQIMERVRDEVVKQQKREELILLLSMIGVLATIIGLIICYFLFYSNTQESLAIPQWKIPEYYLSAWKPYVYITIPTTLLLACDYWLRKKKQKPE